MSAAPTLIVDDQAPLFKPFEWVAPADQTGPYEMLSDARDLAAGTALVLAMIERSQIAMEVGDPPLLDSGSISRLMRMSIAAMTAIEGRIDEHFEDMSDNAAARRLAGKGAAS